VTGAELSTLMAGPSPHAVLDLRERAAYEGGHIFRATNLPRRLLEFQLSQLVTAKRTPIVLCDADGRLAALALPAVRAMGFTDVRVLDGGLEAWRREGRGTITGINVPSKAFGEWALHTLRTPQIPPHELQAWIDGGRDMVIVDSRTPEEYARGCIPGAWSMPGGELMLRIGELAKNPKTTIVVHCGGRTRSYIGAESLRRMGLPNPIVALENGTMGWELAGLTLERGADRRVAEVSEASRKRAAAAALLIAKDDGIASIAPAALEALWARRAEENVALLDVRTREEYEEVHVAGAAWAPGGQTVQATDEYIAVRAARVVLVCDGAGRSIMTAAWLKRMGLPAVSVLAGGLPAWKAGGGAVETGHPDPEPWGYAAARAAVGTLAPVELSAALGGPQAPPAPARATPAPARAPMILSVDQSDVYVRGHVPGAAWLCRSRLEWKAPQALADRARALVLTCRDGRHSTLAAAALARLGYASVRVLEGGTQAWERKGLALETGKTRLLDETDDVVLKPYEKGREAMEAYLKWEVDLDPAALDAARSK
jgi:rhodanese-related sulfurtransferase